MRERNKTAKWFRRAKSTDGFVSGDGQIGKSNRTRVKRESVSLDSFGRRADGFHPMRQSPGGIGKTAEAETEERDALMDEPIVLDDLDYQQRKGRFHGRLRRHVRFKRTLKRAGLVTGVLVLVTLSILGYKFYLTQRQVLSGGGHAPAVCDGNVPLSVLKKEGDGRVNILLAGIGSEGLLTDTIMIASIDPFTDKVDLLSIPRDLWVNIPANGQEKINAAYEFGQKASKSKSAFEKQEAGVDMMDKILENVTGVDIHYHSVFNFTAFKQMVDALGGVTVNVPEILYDPTIAWENNRNPVIASKGTQQFDGSRALLYAKSRETSSDFARSERQQLLLVAIKEKSLSAATYSNPIKVINLLNSLGKNVYSDFDTRSIKCLYEQGLEIQSTNIKSLDLVKPPNDLLTTASLYGRSVVQPKAGLFDYSQVRKYVRTTFRDGFLAKENAPVAIYNATNTPGLATKTADLLMIYGYKVTIVENAPNRANQAATALVDLTKGRNKYTRHYLQMRFGVVAQSGVPGGLGISPPEGTAFVLILGNEKL